MTNPTSNFGWQMPTSTDLVTDLPADFEVFGQAVDTSLADLKGGTSGQILSKASNTSMDFTWITNDVGDITAVTAGTGITGGGTSGAVTVSFDQANFGGGQNSAGKNEVLNSNFSVWQRGTSMAGSATAFSADRWQAYRGVAGSTFSRQLTNDTTNLPNIQYALRVQRDSGNTATNDIIAVQNFESVNSIPFAGKTVTFSFYARAGANYSGSSNQLGGFIYSGTGTDQNTIAGFTGQTTVINSASSTTLTTTWQRFTVTSSSVVPTNCSQIAVAFRYTPVGTAGANDYFEVTGVQLEAANTASPYAPNTSTYQAELAACQRYYWRWPISTTNAQTGIAQSTTITDFYIRTPVTMRANGSAVDFTALQVYNIIGAANYSSGSFTLLQSTVDHLVLRYTHGSAVFTLGAAGYVLNGSGATAYVGITGEL